MEKRVSSYFALKCRTVLERQYDLLWGICKNQGTGSLLVKVMASAQTRYLNQFWLIFSWAFWNPLWYSDVWIETQEDTAENVVCKIWVFLPKDWWFITKGHRGTKRNVIFMRWRWQKQSRVVSSRVGHRSDDMERNSRICRDCVKINISSQQYKCLWNVTIPCHAGYGYTTTTHGILCNITLVGC